VFLLEPLGVLKARRTDINGNNARSGMNKRVFRGLPRSASGYQNIEISAIFLVGPQQMKLSAQNILVIDFTSTFEVFYRGRVRMIRVELADRIGADVFFARLTGAF
jgi:hypothetical protein